MALGGFVVKVDDSRLQAALMKTLRRMEDFPKDRQGAIQGIVRRGLQEGNRILSMGGAINTPRGILSWNRARHPWTRAIRRSYFASRGGGSGDFPLLKMTGRLQAHLYQGSMHAGRRSLAYRVPEAIAPLVEAHQRGLAPLPSLRSGKRPPPGLRLPQRQILFWSNRMVRDVLHEAKDYAQRRR